MLILTIGLDEIKISFPPNQNNIKKSKLSELHALFSSQFSEQSTIKAEKDVNFG
jgi:hypothetical protein